MLFRLLVGSIVGFVVGGLGAAALVEGLKVTAFAGAMGIVLAYAAAALVGVATGLVAGKPIWAAGAKVEAGLKAVFGALLGAGLMFALRQWAPPSWTINLDFAGAGHGALGDLPAASLPLLAAVLGAFFGLDNTDAGSESKAVGPPKDRKRAPQAVSGGQTRSRVADGAPAPRDDEDVPEVTVPKRAKR